MKKSKTMCSGFARVMILLIAGFILQVFSGCKKFIEVPAPDSRFSTPNVFSDETTAQAAMAGIYSSLWDRGFFMALYGGLSADEFTDYSFSASRVEFNQNELEASNPEIAGLWGYFYNTIYQCNAVIEGLEKNQGVPETVKKQLTAEALSVRSFCYYYLLEFWGPVPLLLSTDYEKNAQAPRTATDAIFRQLLADLQLAAPDLPETYSSGENARVTHWANLAMQSRIYACLRDWPGVESVTTEILDQSQFALAGDLDSVFLHNSPEAIWQLEPQDPGMNTYEGNQFILNSTPDVVALTGNLLSAFEVGDQRSVDWVGLITVDGVDYAYPFKYKEISATDPIREYAMVLRLGEQLLLRAEARAEQNNLSGALDDLNQLRRRAGLADEVAADQQSLLSAVTREHQVELFSEWADRWIYLKRTGQLQTVLSAAKPQWQASDSLYPIPLSELKNDPVLTQNAGY
jgi:hypothetical protein